MRGVARERGRHREEPNLPCGAWRLKLAPSPYEVPYSCNRWECEPCRNKKIKKYQDVLYDAQLVIYGYVSEKPPIKTMKDKYNFKNFLKRKVAGEYFYLKSDLRTVIISRCKHPDSTRMLIKDIIDKLLPEVLSEPWAWWAGDRFGRSRKKKVEEDIVVDNADTEDAQDVEPFDTKTPYATWKKHNDPNRFEIKKEFKNLHSEFERYEWLINHMNAVYLEDRGRELLKNFENFSCSHAVSAAGI